MKILSIDTSCDDTGISIIKKQKNNFEIFSNIISSQIKIHKKWGGVYPALAKREHQKNLVPVLIKALKKSNLLKIKKKQIPNSKLENLNSILEREPELLKQIIPFFKKYQKPKINAIAITKGPGLEPCLWVGINFARALSYIWNIPLIPVNHIEAHILANWLMPTNPKFPLISLIVSGGHTQLILMKDYGKYVIIGETRDDAAGECFDKTARILGLEYPGGPAIAAKATTKLKVKNPKIKVKLPRPMIHQKNYDFSFSGLKTAVLYNHKKHRTSEKYIKETATEIQQAIIDVLIHKTIKAAKDYKVKSIIISGGVAANEKLRKQFISKLKKLNIQFFAPEKILCTDNAAMIGITAFFHFQEKVSWKKLKAQANLRINDK